MTKYKKKKKEIPVRGFSINNMIKQSKSDPTFLSGLQAGWELVRKLYLPGELGGYNDGRKLDEIFEDVPIKSDREILTKHTVEEVMDLVQQYESKHSLLKRGDVVRVISGDKALVTGFADNDQVYVLFSDGSCNSCRRSEISCVTGDNLSLRLDGVLNFEKDE